MPTSNDASADKVMKRSMLLLQKGKDALKDISDSVSKGDEAAIWKNKLATALKLLETNTQIRNVLLGRHPDQPQPPSLEDVFATNCGDLSHIPLSITGVKGCRKIYFREKPSATYLILSLLSLASPIHWNLKRNISRFWMVTLFLPRNAMPFWGTSLAQQ